MPNTDIDLSALAEALNDKMDRDLGNKTANIRYVVDEWHSGANWYRVWSDGWIEQGGHTPSTSAVYSLTFNKAFTTTDYTIVLTKKRPGGYNGGGADTTSCIDGNLLTTGCTINQQVDAGMYTFWYACGY